MPARLWGKGNAHPLLVECKLVKPLWKSVLRLLKKFERDASYDTAIPPQGIDPKASPNQYRATCLSTPLAVLITIARKWNGLT